MATTDTGPASSARPFENPSSWVEWLLVAAIVLLAGALRMAAPGLTEFKADEARLLALAYDMAEGELALRGISSSVGIPNFAASVWLYALPTLLWPHPYAATIFTGLLSTFAVFLTYWFLRRYWGTTAALAAALMIAVAPWAVIFSRKIWAQNLLPLFVMGWIIGAALAMVERRPRFMWLHLVCLALAVQIHLSAVALLPVTLLFFIIFRRNIRWRDVLVGGLLAALTVLPFAIYVLGSQDPGRSLAIAAGAGLEGAFSLDSLRHTVMISLGTQLHSLTGAEAFRDYLAHTPDLTLVHLFWGSLILMGIFTCAWAAWKRWSEPRAQVGLMVTIWLFMPALVFLWEWTPSYLHYYITVLPAPFIAAGVAFGSFPIVLKRLLPAASSATRRLLMGVAWLVLAATAAAQAWALILLLNFVSITATPGGFGVPLAMKLEAAHQVVSMVTEKGAAEVLVAGLGELPRIDDFAAEWDVLLRDVPHRFVDATHSALFPSEAAVVLLDGRLEPSVSTGDLYLAAGTTVIEVPLRPGEGTYTILSLPGRARPTPDVAAEPPYLLANWVNLLGYDQPRRLDSKTAVWQIHWRTGDNPDPAEYQFFNHLVNGAGERIGQADAPAYDPDQWRAGDTLISRFSLPYPDTAVGPLAVRVGMYRYPSLENVPLLDEAANPYIDAAEFVIDNRE